MDTTIIWRQKTTSSAESLHSTIWSECGESHRSPYIGLPVQGSRGEPAKVVIVGRRRRRGAEPIGSRKSAAAAPAHPRNNSSRPSRRAIIRPHSHTAARTRKDARSHAPAQRVRNDRPPDRRQVDWHQGEPDSLRDRSAEGSHGSPRRGRRQDQVRGEPQRQRCPCGSSAGEAPEARRTVLESGGRVAKTGSAGT